MKYVSAVYGVTLALAFSTLSCGGSHDDDDATPGGPSEPPAGPSGSFELFSWWTEGGEADGLDALVRTFKNEYPEVQLVNATVAGGGGFDARKVLAERMAVGEPPDSFQIHAGHDLLDTYVKQGKMESLSSLFKAEKWNRVMPQPLIDILSVDGEVYAVPVNIHRANMLWYNKGVFAANGLEPPTTWQEFFAVGDKLKAAGTTPMAEYFYAGGEYIPLLDLVLLGELGPESYSGLWTGDTSWGGDDVRAALVTFKRVFDYAQPSFDAEPITWQDAVQQVSDGDAAMVMMGDWAEGYLTSNGQTPDVDFGWAASPGSSDVFDLLSDTFVLPKGAKNREASLAWLKTAGSKQGQDAFNPLKGSIPARTDANRELYDSYLQFSLDEFTTKTIVPSFTHGAAAAPSWVESVAAPVTAYVRGGDVDTLQSALNDACIAAKVCRN